MLPKDNEEGAMVTLPVPVPDTETSCGLVGSLSVKTRAAVRTPVETGLNRMVVVQLAAGARLLPQVF